MTILITYTIAHGLIAHRLGAPESEEGILFKATRADQMIAFCAGLKFIGPETKFKAQSTYGSGESYEEGQRILQTLQAMDHIVITHVLQDNMATALIDGQPIFKHHKAAEYFLVCAAIQQTEPDKVSHVFPKNVPLPLMEAFRQGEVAARLAATGY